ncbi:unnamed protein product [Dicrocoelium dendriticum]|nr:unnamed protein product [Dicrocoelium dendriticum]
MRSAAGRRAGRIRASYPRASPPHCLRRLDGTEVGQSPPRGLPLPGGRPGAVRRSRGTRLRCSGRATLRGPSGSTRSAADRGSVGDTRVWGEGGTPLLGGGVQASSGSGAGPGRRRRDGGPASGAPMTRALVGAGLVQRSRSGLVTNTGGEELPPDRRRGQWPTVTCRRARTNACRAVEVAAGCPRPPARGRPAGRAGSVRAPVGPRAGSASRPGLVGGVRAPVLVTPPLGTARRLRASRSPSRPRGPAARPESAVTGVDRLTAELGGSWSADRGSQARRGPLARPPPPRWPSGGSDRVRDSLDRVRARFRGRHRRRPASSGRLTSELIGHGSAGAGPDSRPLVVTPLGGLARPRTGTESRRRTGGRSASGRRTTARARRRRSWGPLDSTRVPPRTRGPRGTEAGSVPEPSPRKPCRAAENSPPPPSVLGAGLGLEASGSGPGAGGRARGLVPRAERVAVVVGSAPSGARRAPLASSRPRVRRSEARGVATGGRRGRGGVECPHRARLAGSIRRHLPTSRVGRDRASLRVGPGRTCGGGSGASSAGSDWDLRLPSGRRVGRAAPSRTPGGGRGRGVVTSRDGAPRGRRRSARGSGSLPRRSDSATAAGRGLLGLWRRPDPGGRLGAARGVGATALGSPLPPPSLGGWAVKIESPAARRGGVQPPLRQRAVRGFQAAGGARQLRSRRWGASLSGSGSPQ